MPYYVDKGEVVAIDRFISEIDAGIHYSLHFFYADFYLDDFPNNYLETNIQDGITVHSDALFINAVDRNL